MANTCERAINIVNDNKPKVLEGLSQKWQRSGYKDLSFPCHGQSTLPVERARPNPLVCYGNGTWQPRMSPIRESKPQGEPKDVRA